MVSERNVGTAPRNRFALDVEVRLSSLKALLLIAYHFPNCGVVGSRVGKNGRAPIALCPSWRSASLDTEAAVHCRRCSR